MSIHWKAVGQYFTVVQFVILSGAKGLNTENTRATVVISSGTNPDNG